MNKNPDKSLSYKIVAQDIGLVLRRTNHFQNI